MACPLWAASLEGGPRRVNHSAVLIGRRIFMFGGYCSSVDYESASNLSIDIFEFNTASLQWREVHNRNKTHLTVPYMRYGHSTVAIDANAYLFGGRNDLHGVCNTLFCFDAVKRLWSTPKVEGRIPGPRDGHGMCVANGNIYVFGGYESESDRFSEEVFMLDLSTMTWILLITRGQQGLWRDFHTLTSYNDKIFLFGGRADESGSFTLERHKYDNDVKILDLNSLVWSSAALQNQKLPIGRRSHTAFFHKGCLYVFGGYNSVVSQHFNDLWKFDPETGMWTEVFVFGDGPCQRRRHCCCYFKNKAFMFGGTSPSSPGQDDKYIEDLVDLSDMHILELEPSLKSLCLRYVSKNRHKLDLSCLPVSLRQLIKSMTTNSSVTPGRNGCQG